MSNRYPPGGFDYDNHKELVASLAALRAKNAELETRVKELEEEKAGLENKLLVASVVLENYQHPKIEIETTTGKVPSPAEPEEDV